MALEAVSSAFLILLHQASVGSLFSLAAVLEYFNRRGFFKAVAVTCLSLGGIALGLELASGKFPSLSQAAFLLFLVLFVGSLWLKDEWKSLLLYRLTLVSGMVDLASSAFSFRSGPFLTWASFLLFLGFFTSALLLGSTIAGMLLGHYYLVEPGLSIKPLRRLVALYLTSTLLQGFLILASLAFFFPGGGWPSSRAVLSDHPYALIGRVGMGIFGPLALGVLVWEILNIPHTQAATGLLYVAVVFVVVGELLGRYLLTVSFVPL